MQSSEKALVPFVSVDHMMQLIHLIGLESLLCKLTDAMEADFLRWPAFDKKPRLASHCEIGVIELIPTSDGEVYVFKYLNGHPSNTRTGHQTVTAFGLLADIAAGHPFLLSEMTLLTALRTAATSAMAARVLTPKNAHFMAMIGNGAQSEFRSLAMKAVCGIDTVCFYDINQNTSAKCADKLSTSGLDVIVCATPEQAIEGSQIITTCTADK